MIVHAPSLQAAVQNDAVGGAGPLQLGCAQGPAPGLRTGMGRQLQAGCWAGEKERNRGFGELQQGGLAPCPCEGLRALGAWGGVVVKAGAGWC